MSEHDEQYDEDEGMDGLALMELADELRASPDVMEDEFFWAAAVHLGAGMTTSMFSTSEGDIALEITETTLADFVRFVQLLWHREYGMSMYEAGRLAGQQEMVAAMTESMAATKN